MLKFKSFICSLVQRANLSIGGLTFDVLLLTQGRGLHGSVCKLVSEFRRKDLIAALGCVWEHFTGNILVVQSQTSGCSLGCLAMLLTSAPSTRALLKPALAASHPENLASYICFCSAPRSCLLHPTNIGALVNWLRHLDYEIF